VTRATVVRKRRVCVVIDPCSCGCGALLLPGAPHLTGDYGGEKVAFAGFECFGRWLDARRPS
jgi:hypothetical protein